jgi:tRNA threonylcarbamoyladenosine biosynthesis protein TsaE
MSRRSFRLVLDGPQDTLALGSAMGGLLRGGEVLALVGPLGAGKTLLVKGLARGLGVRQSEPVVSPTFVLVREYRGRLRLVHCDAYRLGSADELVDLGLDDMLDDPETVIAVEWADRVIKLLPDDSIRIELAHRAGGGRECRGRLPAYLEHAVRPALPRSPPSSRA